MSTDEQAPRPYPFIPVALRQFQQEPTAPTAGGVQPNSAEDGHPSELKVLPARKGSPLVTTLPDPKDGHQPGAADGLSMAFGWGCRQPDGNPVFHHLGNSGGEPLALGEMAHLLVLEAALRDLGEAKVRQLITRGGEVNEWLRDPLSTASALRFIAENIEHSGNPEAYFSNLWEALDNCLRQDITMLFTEQPFPAEAIRAEWWASVDATVRALAESNLLFGQDPTAVANVYHRICSLGSNLTAILELFLHFGDGIDAVGEEALPERERRMLLRAAQDAFDDERFSGGRLVCQIGEGRDDMPPGVFVWLGRDEDLAIGKTIATKFAMVTGSRLWH